MSSALDFDRQKDWQNLVNRWNAAGHTIVYERGTYRHKAYIKEFPPETVIQRDMDGKSIPYLTSTGHTLTYGDVLPERADLCLDQEAKMVPKHVFEKRYEEFIKWFNYIQGAELDSVYVPDHDKWISQIPDPFSESPGSVEAGWDARKPAPPESERTERYDPRLDKMIEIQQEDRKRSDLTTEALVKFLEESKSTPQTEIAVVTPVAATEPEPPKRRGPGRPRKEES